MLFEYIKYRSHLSNKAYDVNNNGSAQDQKNIEDKISTINKVISNLKKTSFKKNLNSECIEMFHDAKFEEKLDTNVNLVGFEKIFHVLMWFVWGLHLNVIFTIF